VDGLLGSRGMHLSQLIDAAVAEDAARATRASRPRKKKK